MGAQDFSLEVGIKSLNYTADFLLQFMKQFYKLAPLEGYLSGNCEVHKHVRWKGSAYCLTETSGRYGPLTAGGPLRRNKKPVLIGVVDGRESFGPRDVVERLQPLDDCLMFDAQVWKPQLLSVFGPISMKVLFPTLFGIFDRKFRALTQLSRVQVEKLEHEIIEGRSKVVRNLTNEDWDDLGRIEFDGLRIPRDRDGLEASVVFDAEPLEVFLAPRYSRPALIQGWLSAIGERHA